MKLKLNYMHEYANVFVFVRRQHICVQKVC